MKMKMSQLVKLSGVPTTTIHYYIKEGILPAPERINKRMSLYDESMIERLKTIQGLQEKRYPLTSIKSILDRIDRGIPLEEAESVEHALFGLPVHDADELIDRVEYMERTGLTHEELEEVERLGLLMPFIIEKGEPLYDQDDVAMGKNVFKMIFNFNFSPEELNFYLTLGRQITEREFALREKFIRNTTEIENLRRTVDLTYGTNLTRAYFLKRLFQQMSRERTASHQKKLLSK